MKIGDYECYALETGRFALDGGAMFGVVPRVLWEKKIPADNLNRIPMATRSLLILGKDKRILVDTGAGDKWTDKQKEIYKIDQEKSNLIYSLQRFNLNQADITDVVLSHLHFDHTGGSTYISGDRILPTFPAANYWIQKQQWEAANNPTPKDRASFLKENFLVLQEKGLVRFLEGETELYEGIRILISNGHTTAQQHPLVYGDNKALFFCGDLIPTSAHLPIPWVMAYDNFPLTTIEEKSAILNQALKENWVLFFEHDPEIGACTVKEGKRGAEIAQVINL